MTTVEKYWGVMLAIIVVCILGLITYSEIVIGPDRWEFRWNNCLEDHLYDYCRLILKYNG